MLKIPLNPYNIDITHPLRNNDKGQPVIILRLLNRHIRHEIYYYRKLLLVRYNITVSEHLTPENLILKRKAEAIVGSDNVWTYDCKMYALSRGKTINIRNEKSLSFLHAPSYASVLERRNPTSR